MNAAEALKKALEQHAAQALSRAVNIIGVTRKRYAASPDASRALLVVAEQIKMFSLMYAPSSQDHPFADEAISGLSNAFENAESEESITARLLERLDRQDIEIARLRSLVERRDDAQGVRVFMAPAGLMKSNTDKPMTKAEAEAQKRERRERRVRQNEGNSIRAQRAARVAEFKKLVLDNFREDLTTRELLVKIGKTIAGGNVKLANKFLAEAGLKCKLPTSPALTESFPGRKEETQKFKEAFAEYIKANLDANMYDAIEAVGYNNKSVPRIAQAREVLVELRGDVVIEKPKTTRDRIVEFFQADPTATPRDCAERLGLLNRLPYIYTIISKNKLTTGSSRVKYTPPQPAPQRSAALQPTLAEPVSEEQRKAICNALSLTELEERVLRFLEATPRRVTVSHMATVLKESHGQLRFTLQQLRARKFPQVDKVL